MRARPPGVGRSAGLHWRFPWRAPALLSILTCRLLALLVLRFRSQRSKDLEIVVLRHALAVLRRQVVRPDLAAADRVFLAAASRLVPNAMCE